MTIIQTKLLNIHSYIYFKTDITITFEYPFEIFGINHNYSITSKPLLLNIPDCKSDYVFISSSNSLGVLFSKAQKIYITKPVYEQLLLRLEELPRRLYYEESEAYKIDRLVSIEDFDIKNFVKRCVFISYNEIIKIQNVEVQCISAGTCIGWCNYHVTVNNITSYLFVSSYSFQKRMSQIASYKPCDYLIIYEKENLQSVEKENYLNGIDDLFSVVMHSAARKEPIVIVIDIISEFMDIYTRLTNKIKPNIKNIQIFVCSKIFKKYASIMNVQSEWFNDSLIKRAYLGEKILDFSSCKIFESVYEIEAIPDVLFISHIDFILFGVKKYFENQVVVTTNKMISSANFVMNNWFNSSVSDIIQRYDLTHILANFEHNEAQLISPDLFYSFEDVNKDRFITFNNSNLIEFIVKKKELSFFVEGYVTQKDSNISIDHEEETLATLFATKRYALINGKYYFFMQNLVVELKDNKCIIENINNVSEPQ